GPFLASRRGGGALFLFVAPGLLPLLALTLGTTVLALALALAVFAVTHHRLLPRPNAGVARSCAVSRQDRVRARACGFRMLTRAPRAPRSAVERGQQLADAVWLGQEMRTLGQVFELRTLVTRGHHDARPWLLLQRFGRDGQARHALGHADVGDHVRKGVSALELLQGLAPVPGHGDLVTVIGERALDDEAQVVLVLHEQHVQRAHPASGTGRRITTVAPLP